MKQCKHLKIYGRVQGVFFRESMVREARRLNAAGWVRNCADGSVEAMVQGEPQAVAALLEWARHGPELARVNRVEAEDGVGEAEFTGFVRF
ncbi:MAG: acylphosphatase [Pseudomonadota bacterium]